VDDDFDLGLSQGTHFTYENGTWNVGLALHVERLGVEPGHINHHLKPPASRGRGVRYDGIESPFMVQNGMLKIAAGRALAAMPKSTSQTSPRLALSISLLLFFVSEKGLFGGGDQVSFRNHTVRIVVNNAILALAVLLMHRFFHAPKFFGRQFR
jgi:hypothetical protein